MNNVPQFGEYCIDARDFLSSTRDRSACSTCPLHELCDVGFQEQGRRAQAGKDPDFLRAIPLALVAQPIPDLLDGLTSPQKLLMLSRIPSLAAGVADIVHDGTAIANLVVKKGLRAQHTALAA